MSKKGYILDSFGNFQKLWVRQGFTYMERLGDDD